MNKIILIFVLLITGFSFGQSPQGFKYQAVVRNADGVLLFNHVVSVKSSILADSPTGTAVYSETQTLATNEYGVVSLNVGEGTVLSGTFGSIAWGATTYFLKTELDLSGGSNFQFMGTSQIMSVPYALYAAKAGASLNDQDTSASNEIQTLSVSGNNLSISNGNEVVIDSNPTNELQSLSIVGHELTISEGNTVTIPPDEDSDSTNELQSLSLNGNDLTISNGNTILIDSDPLNELQSLSIVGDSLKLTNGNAVYLSGNIDLDASPTNELQLLSKSGDTLFLSNGNFVVLDHDADVDSTNEVQTLSNTAGSISISKGNTILLQDSSATNELQTLSLQNDTLIISNGNSVVFNHDNDVNSTNEIQTLSIVGDSLHISQGNAVKIKEHYVGELWGGGVVYHVYKDSLGVQHGLVAAKSNLINTDASLIAPYYDLVNTDTFYINNGGNLPDITAFNNLCSNLVISDFSGIYNDWYVPNIKELIILFNNINFLLVGNSFFDKMYPFQDGYYKMFNELNAYLSSTQYNAFAVLGGSMISGFSYKMIQTLVLGNYSGYFHVRPIRKF